MGVVVETFLEEACLKQIKILFFHFLSLKAWYVLNNLKIRLLKMFYSTSFFLGTGT